MARKSAAAPAAAKTARKGPARKRSAPRTSTRAKPEAAASAMPGFGEMPKMPKMMTPEQAIDLYKANAALALDVINTAIEGTARLRRKQFEGEEEAREFQKRHTRSAVEARDAQSLMMAGQGAAQEALEKSMHYWGEMFDLIVEIQKRLFSLMEEQMEDVPGVKESKAAMAMLPDLRQMQKVVSAMQGVVSSGGSAFETMQRVMGDFAKMAQGSMPGAQR
ncbi:MAG: phasin family protein [Betaproteobacteria bacterium]